MCFSLIALSCGETFVTSLECLHIQKIAENLGLTLLYFLLFLEWTAESFLM